MTNPHRCAGTSRPHEDGTPRGRMRNILREGWYVREKAGKQKAPEGIVKGLQRAFPLPASGAFDDLLKAIDLADAGKSGQEE
jgi:hypothetical protein